MSKLGNEFRNILDLWEENKKDHNLKMLIDGQNMILFFKHQGDLFGTQEQHRVTYAKMVNPDPNEDPKGWADEANFLAINLTKASEGQESQQVFKLKDIKNINVVEKDKAMQMLNCECKEETKPKTKTEEYNGIDPFTCTQFRDGKEFHYRREL